MIFRFHVLIIFSDYDAFHWKASICSSAHLAPLTHSQRCTNSVPKPLSCKKFPCGLQKLGGVVFTIGLQSHVVLIGQVKQYFAYESRHQHGAFDMTGGFKHVYFYPYLGKSSNWTSIFFKWVETTNLKNIGDVWGKSTLPGTNSLHLPGCAIPKGFQVLC